MCGINGFNFKDENLIRSMVAETKHRGPDSDGVFLDDGISLGHNRLSIIDLSENGRQPMFNQAKDLVIVFNGEIYNYQEIKKELSENGVEFFSNSDTEVILKAYEKYGKDCVKKFNGIFAFAIWDKRKKELFAARDQFGVKPFFYFFDGQKFIFSSEIKGILKHGIKRELDLDSLNAYFRFLYIAGPRTIFKNIYKLQAGHCLLLSGMDIKIEKYWQFDDFGKIEDREAVKEKTRELLSNAVKRQLIADVPVGLFLSGGLDSNIMLALMAEQYPGKIKTFSVGFDVGVNRDKFNADAELAKKSSSFYGTDHHEIFMNGKDALSNVEKVTWHLDDLVSNTSQISTYMLAQLASKDVKVVLSGDGGDELFGGYPRYYYCRMIERWRKIPSAVRNGFLSNKIFKMLKKGEYYEKLNLESDFKVFCSFAMQKEKILSRFLKPVLFSSEGNFLKMENLYFSGSMPEDITSRIMLADMQTWMIDESLTRSDKMCMAHGLEQRVPFLDIDVARFAMKIPTRFKINSKVQGKLILKQAMKDKLPEYIYDKEKTGWMSPVSTWLRTDLKDFAYEVLSDNFNQGTKEFFDFSEIKKILDNHISQKEYALNTIWSLITFQLWYREFMRADTNVEKH